jgi:hypothetical protein
VRLLVRLHVVLPVILALASLSAPALAEPTSWLAVGTGYSLQRNGDTHSNDSAFALSGLVGVGTPATAPVIVGGVFRAVGYLGPGADQGADMSIAVRLATRSYCVGDWGVALDLGVGARFWGDHAYGQYPVQGVLTIGMPFGFQLALGADVWDVGVQSPVAEGGFVALEIDLLRLTSMRSGATTRLWSNPAPANAPPAPTPAIP